MNYVNLLLKKWYFIGLIYDYIKGMVVLWIDGRMVRGKKKKINVVFICILGVMKL